MRVLDIVARLVTSQTPSPHFLTPLFLSSWSTMKSSLIFVTALFLPDVFAAAVPSKPQVVAKRFPHPNSAPVKRDASFESDGTRAHYEKAAAGGDPDLKHRELLPRRAGPLVVDGPSTTPTSTSTPFPDTTLVNGPSAVPTSASTPFPTTTLAGDVGYLPPDPAQNIHNSLVGGHPFGGHGPAIATPASYVGMSDTNITFVIPAAGTAPPIANATATIYADPAPTAACLPHPVPEAVDSNGNFLPTDQQPGYNGSVSTNGTVPGSCSAPSTSKIPEDQVIIEGHMEGDTEVVEVDIIPLPSNSTLSTYYGAGFTPSGTPTMDSGSAASTTGPSAPISTGASQPVPDAGNPGFTGPTVRNLHAV